MDKDTVRYSRSQKLSSHRPFFWKVLEGILFKTTGKRRKRKIWRMGNSSPHRTEKGLRRMEDKEAETPQGGPQVRGDPRQGSPFCLECPESAILWLPPPRVLASWLTPVCTCLALAMLMVPAPCPCWPMTRAGVGCEETEEGK